VTAARGARRARRIFRAVAPDAAVRAALRRAADFARRGDGRRDGETSSARAALLSRLHRGGAAPARPGAGQRLAPCHARAHRGHARLSRKLQPEECASLRARGLHRAAQHRAGRRAAARSDVAAGALRRRKSEVGILPNSDFRFLDSELELTAPIPNPNRDSPPSFCAGGSAETNVRCCAIPSPWAGADGCVAAFPPDGAACRP
jgi:hypothetical protein